MLYKIGNIYFEFRKPTIKITIFGEQIYTESQFLVSNREFWVMVRDFAKELAKDGVAEFGAVVEVIEKAVKGLR